MVSSTLLSDKGSATRVRVLAQARELLVRKGYGNLVMREVAEVCGMKLGNLQYYFPTHDALVMAIIEAETALDVEAVENVLQKHQEPEKRLRAVVNELVTRWRGESGVVFSTLNLLVLHNKVYHAIYHEIRSVYYGFLEEVIAATSPGQTKQEYATRARLLCALIDGVPFQTNIGRKADYLARVQELAYAIAIGAASSKSST